MEPLLIGLLGVAATVIAGLLAYIARRNGTRPVAGGSNGDHREMLTTLARIEQILRDRLPRGG